jgi:hypothetical protein
MVAGIMLLFATKYLVFGVTAWNSLLHPGLIPAPNQRPFLKPFLGIFGG